MKTFFITSTSLRELFLRIPLVLLALLLFSGNSFAGTVNLAWDPSISSSVGGYKIAYGTSTSNYTSTVDAGNKTSYSVSGLQDGAKYFFAVKAYDTNKTTESAYSNEINATVPTTTTPTITADFTANKTSGTAPLTVDFTPVTTGTITSWKWDFPGSYTPSVTNSSAKVATVTYPTPGTYSVSLTVTGSSGSVTKTKPSFITVSGTAPVANFSATPTSGVAPLVVNFTDTSSGSITSRSWNFGDGSTSTATNPSHTYSVTGTYTVSLTVTGSGGSNTKTNSNFINVASSGGTTQPPATSTDGLVAAYGFEETSGTTVTDASGKGNNGTIKEAVRISNGRFGNALKFDGINDWVTVNDSASLDLSSDMTLEAWVYPQQSMPNDWRTIIMKEQTGGAVYNLNATNDTNLPGFSYHDGAWHSLNGPEPLPLNQWTHLVATYDGNVQQLYINGVMVASRNQTGLIPISDGALRIGGNSILGEFFQGYIDEVRIYNRALSAEEVSSNMATRVNTATSDQLQLIMGNGNVEPWAEYRAQGTAEAFQAVAQKSGSVSEVKVYLDAGSTATELVAGIYTNRYGHPRTLLAQGKSSMLKPGEWSSVSIPAASVTAGQSYWIAILGTKGQVGFRDRVGSGTSVMETSASTTLTALPSRWTATTSKGNASMSVYGNGK
jgi:PKD repeat protein